MVLSVDTPAREVINVLRSGEPVIIDPWVMYETLSRFYAVDYVGRYATMAALYPSPIGALAFVRAKLQGKKPPSEWRPAPPVDSRGARHIREYFGEGPQ